MAIQIIKRSPTFKEEIGRGLGAGLGEGLRRGMEARSERKRAEALQQQQEMQEAQENESISQSLGIDLSGIRDPKMRQEVLGQALQGKRAEQLEMLKQGSKGQREQEKQNFLNQLLGGQQEQANQGQQEGMGQQFDPSQLTDAQIARASAMDPNLGRALGHAKDVALREKSAQQSREFEREKFEEQQRKATPEFQREQNIEKEQAKADIKYNQELQAAAKQHDLKTQTLDKLEKLNEKGVTGKPYEKLLEKFGLINLTSEGRREFAADVKNLITDIRSILGAQFSQFEFQTILNAYPSADFSKEANSAIIKNLKEFQDIRHKEFEIAKEIKKENKGKLPSDFQSQVNDKLNEYAQSRLPEIKANTQRIMAEEYGIKPGNVLMFDPKGEPLEVSPQDVERYQGLGASLP